jgi:hypothetical protein
MRIERRGDTIHKPLRRSSGKKQWEGVGAKAFSPFLQPSHILALRALSETGDAEPRRGAVVLWAAVGANDVAQVLSAAGGLLLFGLGAEAADDGHACEGGWSCRREGSGGERGGGACRAAGWGEEEGHCCGGLVDGALVA